MSLDIKRLEVMPDMGDFGAKFEEMIKVFYCILTENTVWGGAALFIKKKRLSFVGREFLRRRQMKRETMRGGLFPIQLRSSLGRL